MELLVAVAVMALVSVLILSIIDATIKATRFSNSGVDAAAQARLALDSIGMDLANAVIRSDADFQVSNSTTNLFAFLSAVPSADPSANFTNRHASFVSYRLGTNDAVKHSGPCLLRAGKAIAWNDRSYMGILTNGITTNGTVTNTLPVRFSGADFPASLLPADTDYDVLGPAVLHAEVGFQLYPSGQSVTLADGTVVSQAQGQVVYSPPMRSATTPGNTYIDPTRISAILVGVVVIDPEKSKLLTPAQAQTLAQAFELSATSLADTSNPLPVGKWMAATQDLANLPSSVPLPVRQSVRLYQRFFPVTPFQIP
jgi:Tfp pilus assembly protein FimT